MDYSAAHVGFVLAAYGLSALVLLTMIASVIRWDRKLRRKAREERSSHDQ